MSFKIGDIRQFAISDRCVITPKVKPNTAPMINPEKTRESVKTAAVIYSEVNPISSHF